MILVILGTQDKEFKRLVRLCNEIKDEDILIQMGNTKEISIHRSFDFCSAIEFNKLIDQAELIISHGGVGALMSSLFKNKKVIAIPRLMEYKEHQNDHQIEIVKFLEKKDYLIAFNKGDNLKELIKLARSKKFSSISSNNQNFVNKIKEYIDKM